MTRPLDRPVPTQRIEPAPIARPASARVLDRAIVALVGLAALWFVGQLIRAALAGRL